jgi:DNA-binding GntR family transcriptional regulator
VRAVLRDAAEEIRHLDIADGDRNNFIREDMSVHHLIYRASGNAHLESVLIRYENLATRIWCLVIDRLPDLAEHIRNHAPLLERSPTAMAMQLLSSRSIT